jgi:acyl carrier protein
MPDPSLGEDVAAAVVVNNTSVTEKELRQFTNIRLSYFKVPRRIVILDEIPKGPTGKLQRIGLAEKLGLIAEDAQSVSERAKFIAARNPVEEALARIWHDVLDVEGIGVHDQFLDLGGDSLLASQLIARLRETLDLEINLIDFFDAPTIAEQALIIQKMILNEEQ